MNITDVKKQQQQNLEACCVKLKVNVSSIMELLKAEKTKKLLKRNHYILPTIDTEIEKALKNENF